MVSPITPERWRQIRDLFDAAVRLDGEERSVLLDQICGSDVELRSEVETLLAADGRAGGFLRDPSAGRVPVMGGSSAVPGGLAPSDDSVPAVTTVDNVYHAGLSIGPYRLLRPIASGGMGAVWLAERADEQYRQEVAIKLIRRGLDTDDLLDRFRRERQLLANLRHPHISRLLDGGATDDGRPYLAMEYVQGLPLDRYCDEHRLTIFQRLELFLKVCSGVHFAHQNLVVHRDLKPSNILVGDDGQPVLLDFGIAKLLQADPPLRDTHPAAARKLTLTGHRVMTPAFRWFGRAPVLRTCAMLLRAFCRTSMGDDDPFQILHCPARTECILRRKLTTGHRLYRNRRRRRLVG